MTEKWDVIVVGAGPVGLMAANLIGAAGMRALVVEQAAAVRQSSRAIGIMPPSLEILDHLEVAKAVIDQGVRVTRAHVHGQRRYLGQVSFHGIVGRFPHVLAIPQYRTETILVDNLKRYDGITLQQETRAIAVEQQRDRVQVAVVSLDDQSQSTATAPFVIASDGDLQEGVASEACSLAGHLGLDNLIVVYDDNHISIDGDTDLAFTEDRAKRFKAYGWNVRVVEGDGNDMAALEKALKNARREKQRPTLIKLRTHIAYGSPNMQDTAAAHGAPLGDDEIKLIKENFGWDPEKSFHVPEEVQAHMETIRKKGKRAETAWNKLMAKYSEAHPELAAQFNDAAAGKLPVDLDGILPDFEAGSSVATRKASGKVLDALMPKLPLVMGGSADLTPSNNTRWSDAKDFQKDARDGRYLRYGIREHGMGAIVNGISVSGLARAYGGTFLVFSDYMRGAIRVAAGARGCEVGVLQFSV